MRDFSAFVPAILSIKLSNALFGLNNIVSIHGILNA